MMRPVQSGRVYSFQSSASKPACAATIRHFPDRSKKFSFDPFRRRAAAGGTNSMMPPKRAFRWARRAANTGVLEPSPPVPIRKQPTGQVRSANQPVFCMPHEPICKLTIWIV
jgi:hypothetical protein